MRRQRKFLIVVFTFLLLAFKITHVDEHRRPAKVESLPEVNELTLDTNTSLVASFEENKERVFYEVTASGAGAVRSREAPASTYDKHEKRVRRPEIRKVVSSEVFPESILEALFVFTFVRQDLLELHLMSIDLPVKRVFVILNNPKPDVVEAFQMVLNKYQGCHHPVREDTCTNSNIRNLYILASEENVGYAGSYNIGIKLMIQLKIQFAFFSGDDTRFVPGRLIDAKHIMEHGKACMYHFEGYNSFGVTMEAVNLLGPMDENFWPAYCEDCDYWFRAQLAGCRLFYRGGYTHEVPTSENKRNAFMEHGDVKSASTSGSSTFKSDPSIEAFVRNGISGRFAYLERKWGFNTCNLYHEVLNKWRDADVILDAFNFTELLERGAKWALPYNDSKTDIRHWFPHDLQLFDLVSSRTINSQWAPTHFVWQGRDYAKLSSAKVMRSMM